MATMTTAHHYLADALLADARDLLGTPAAFGDRKVFLAAVLGPIAGQDMTEVAALLGAGLLQFARADLVAAMDPELVAASEWKLDGATFHFIVVA
jgi:hypothetical protein